jgi:hypothetical protein
MTPIPDSWKGPFAPRDPLREPPPTWPSPTQSTPDRVESERAAVQRSFEEWGAQLRRQAGQ